MKGLIYWSTKMTLLLLIACCVWACRRQDLEYEFVEEAQIPVYVDWRKADIHPQNVSVLVYNRDSEELVLEHRFAHNGNAIQSYINLPVGHYVAVVFNEIRDQIDYVRISGHEKLSTLKAYPTENRGVLARVDDKQYVNAPGILAAAVVRDLEITEEMIAAKQVFAKTKKMVTESEPITTDALMHVVPERKVGRCVIRIAVKGLHNSRLPVLADLKHLTGGYWFNTDRNELRLCTQQLSINESTFDEGSKKNGVISAEVATFGVLGERFSMADQPEDAPLTLLLRFMLVDAEKTIKQYVLDVSNQTTLSQEENGGVLMTIEGALPETLPEVIPDGSKGASGFNTSLIDWGVVDVPLIAE